MIFPIFCVDCGKLLIGGQASMRRSTFDNKRHVICASLNKAEEIKKEFDLKIWIQKPKQIYTRKRF